MFIHYRTKAIVFGETAQEEADKLFSLFTKDFGRVEVLGRAIRKTTSKLRAFIPLFSLCHIEFIQGKGYKILTDSVLIKDFENTKEDLARLKVAYKIAEILGRSLKGEERDPRLWRLLIETFEVVNSSSLSVADCLLAYYYFFWNFISQMGYSPELYNCVFCRKKLKPENIYFGKEGVICSLCYSKEKVRLRKKGEKVRKVDPDTVKIIREIFKRDIPGILRIKIKKGHLERLRRISNNYFFWIIVQSIGQK